MKKLKTLTAVAVFAVCLNSQPLLNRISSTAPGSHRVSEMRHESAQPQYAAVLGDGQSLGTQIAIGVTLGVAAALIGVATGGAGAIAAGALAGA